MSNDMHDWRQERPRDEITYKKFENSKLCVEGTLGLRLHLFLEANIPLNLVNIFVF